MSLVPDRFMALLPWGRRRRLLRLQEQLEQSIRDVEDTQAGLSEEIQHMSGRLHALNEDFQGSKGAERKILRDKVVGAARSLERTNLRREKIASSLDRLNSQLESTKTLLVSPKDPLPDSDGIIADVEEVMDDIQETKRDIKELGDLLGADIGTPALGLPQARPARSQRESVTDEGAGDIGLPPDVERMLAENREFD